MASAAALRVAAARALASPPSKAQAGAATTNDDAGVKKRVAVVDVDYAGSAAAAVRRSGLGRPLADAVFCFHTAAFAWFARVWAWHLTPAAAYLPGARGFGWFFRYLTFWSFTLQTAALGVCVASHLARAPKRRAALARAADDAACALFGLANVVTIMYFGLEAATAAVVEGGPAPRPRWLGFAVHAGNAATAWADLLLAHPRSFSPRAARGAVGVAAAYSAWLLVVKLVAGAFPYPILEALPQPHGYLCLTAVAVGLLGSLFAVGRALSTPLLRVKTKLGWPTE